MLTAASAFAQETGWVVPDVGTGVIRGRVVAAATGRSLARARVILSSSPGNPRHVVTDERGVFEFTHLPAAQYEVRANSTGYLTLGFGQSHPSDPPAPLDIKDGQVRSDIEIALPSGGVIEVRVTDESGAPVEGAFVQAQRPQRGNDGELRLAPTIADKQLHFATDDRGVLRLYDLGPGDYYVSATTPVVLGQRHTRRVQIFHPGVAALTDAVPVALEFGQEVQLDIVIAQPYTATHRSQHVARGGAMTVHVTDDLGAPLAGWEVRVLEVRGEGADQTFTRARSTATSSPRFWEKRDFYTDDRGDARIYGLPPAEYVVGTGGVFFPGSLSRADAHALSIRPWDDVNLDIAVAANRTARIAGRVVKWDGEPGRTFVVLGRNPASPLYPQGLVTDSMFRAELVDGEFHFDDIGPGDYIIRTSYDPKSRVRDGVAELAITVEGEDISDLLLTTVPER
jgi:protocatechuate 3,4-dioxygenase beta subunit